jgi:hypothetical protein
MFSYYFSLGVRSLRRNPVLTGLMVLTLAIGVAASISTLTILHVMSGNPIPHKSARLLVPVLDTDPVRNLHAGQQAGRREDDVQGRGNLLARRLRRAPHRAVRRERRGRTRASPTCRWCTCKGIAVGGRLLRHVRAPLLRGGAWAAEDDVRGHRDRPEPEAGRETVRRRDPAGKRLRVFGRVRGGRRGRYLESGAALHHLMNATGGTFAGEDESLHPVPPPPSTCRSCPSTAAPPAPRTRLGLPGPAGFGMHLDPVLVRAAVRGDAPALRAWWPTSRSSRSSAASSAPTPSACTT